MNIFQLTTSRRGRQSQWFIIRKWGYFNSRPHEEVDNNSFNNHLSVQIFQLTTSRRGRRAQQQYLNYCKIFQLTTSRRGRLMDTLSSLWDMNFNSRPHEEVDYYLRWYQKPFDISTHDLTKRSTAISYNTTSFKIVFFVLILYFWTFFIILK